MEPARRKLSTTRGIWLKPIGKVRNRFTRRSLKAGRHFGKGEISELVLHRRWAEAADGVEGFSHLVVLFWAHLITPEGRRLTKVHPRRRQDLPLTGVFATRSPARPNPIGVTMVRLLERKGNVLIVEGMDALNGSPIIDIKPYIPQPDEVAGAMVPDWVTKHGQEPEDPQS
jgi:tRNA-Thr(GGU) m(6)t(6)A37 methyltransferase TsaA